MHAQVSLGHRDGFAELLVRSTKIVARQSTWTCWRCKTNTNTSAYTHTHTETDISACDVCGLSRTSPAPHPATVLLLLLASTSCYFYIDLLHKRKKQQTHLGVIVVVNSKATLQATWQQKSLKDHQWLHERRESVITWKTQNIMALNMQMAWLVAMLAD